MGLGMSFEGDDVSDDAMPASLRDTGEYRQLMTLTALRRSRLRPPPRAAGQCPPVSAESRDLLRHAGSTSSHDVVDADYMITTAAGVSSYLDPNYMPAGL